MKRKYKRAPDGIHVKSLTGTFKAYKVVTAPCPVCGDPQTLEGRMRQHLNLHVSQGLITEERRAEIVRNKEWAKATSSESRPSKR